LGRLTSTATKDSIAPFSLSNFSRFFSDGRKGMRHQIPASFSFKLLRFFTVSPSVNYEEKWYGERYDWTYENDSTTIVKSTPEKGFYRISNYSFSAGISTRIYGMYLVKNKNSSIKAIRHIINPTVSFGYTPDFSSNSGYFKKLDNYIVDKSGHHRINERAPNLYEDRFAGGVYGGGSTLGKSGSIGFGIGNNLEMKVQKPADSVARKVMLLNNLSLSSSYNIIADSFKLAPISIAANTNLLDNLLNLNVSAILDPYYIQTTYSRPANSTSDELSLKTERRMNNLAWKTGSIGRVTSATMAISSNLNPKARQSQNKSREKIGKSELPEQEKQFLLQNPDAYVDFDVPWSMNLAYNLSYNHSINMNPTITQTVNMSGDVSISASWKITYSSGYHFESKAFTQTNLGIARDIHCWTMRLNWTPFGKFQSYNFTIAVKSSVLQDLKLERRKPFFDNL
ncbi:MAG: putative LPS assembly protein LptD, partial [Chryseolinea sp.]